MKIKISSESINAFAELKDTETAKTIYNTLPIEGSANRWGDEIYFVMSIKLACDADAKDIVGLGDVAYWPEGACFCIFFGKTPASKGEEIRAASKVNVFGKIIGDCKVFKKVKSNDLVILERA